jgi:hypothetical protein
MRILACFGLLLVVGCGSNSSGNDMAMSADLSMSPDLMMPVMGCGAMGDMGNSKHVGQYCDATHACPMPTVCASAYFPGATFCTIGAACNCPSGMGCTDTATCGEMTTCIYSATFGLAGCAPAACMGLPQG